jgi:hypothetical protein
MLSPPVFTYSQEKTKEGLCPDFLWSLVALANLMQLSLLKAAHAVMSGAAYRKSGSPILFNPCTRKSANMGHPSRGKAGEQARDLSPNQRMKIPTVRFRLFHVVFDSLDRVAKNLFQAHGRQAVSLAEVFVDLIPVIHPWSGKAN